MNSSRHLEIYSVGRENARIPCDIMVPAAEVSVSRPHLEITVTEDGMYYVVDVGSANGTSVLRDGQWHRLTQDYVRENERLRLGTYETTIQALLGRNGRTRNERSK